MPTVRQGMLVEREGPENIIDDGADDGERVRLPDVAAWRDDRHFVPARMHASGTALSHSSVEIRSVAA